MKQRRGREEETHRISAHIDADVHKNLKIASLMTGKSMTLLVEEILQEFFVNNPEVLDI